MWTADEASAHGWLPWPQSFAVRSTAAHSLKVIVSRHDVSGPNDTMGERHFDGWLLRAQAILGLLFVASGAQNAFSV